MEVAVKPWDVSCVLLFISLALLLAKADENQKGFSGASFIFGDSVVDAGNNNYFFTLSKANRRPFGIDFKPSGGNPTGRYTNGRTVVDIIGEELGQPHYAVPFLAPISKGEAILNGVNYASGGAGILNATGKIFIEALQMDVQVDYFRITRREVDKILGPSKAGDFVARNSIFFVSVGSNDFLGNYLLPGFSIATRILESPDDFTDDMIKHLRCQLTKLYRLDARKFVVGNIGPIGCIPAQKTMNPLNQGQCVDFPNKLAVQYNYKLKALLDELNANLPEAIFVYANVYDLAMDLITNYDQYGFSTASRACCGNGGQLEGIAWCGPTSTLCSDRSTHVFWDAYHFTEAANLVIAQRLLDGDATHISPLNLRQLRHL